MNQIELSNYPLSKIIKNYGEKLREELEKTANDSEYEKMIVEKLQEFLPKQFYILKAFIIDNKEIMTNYNQLCIIDYFNSPIYELPEKGYIVHIDNVAAVLEVGKILNKDRLESSLKRIKAFKNLSFSQITDFDRKSKRSGYTTAAPLSFLLFNSSEPDLWQLANIWANSYHEIEIDNQHDFIFVLNEGMACHSIKSKNGDFGPTLGHHTASLTKTPDLELFLTYSKYNEDTLYIFYSILLTHLETFRAISPQLKPKHAELIKEPGVKSIKKLSFKKNTPSYQIISDQQKDNIITQTFLDPSHEEIIFRIWGQTTTFLQLSKLGVKRKKKIFDIMESLRHKLGAVRNHLDNYNRLENEYKMTLLNERIKENKKIFLLEFPKLTYELEAFFFQIKSSLDILVKIIIPALFIDRSIIPTFGDKGDKIIKILQNNVPQYLSKKQKNTVEDLIEMIKEDQQRGWINKMVRIRDTISHFKKLSNFYFQAQLSEEGIQFVIPPRFTRQQFFRDALESLWHNIITFCEDFLCLTLSSTLKKDYISWTTPEVDPIKKRRWFVGKSKSTKK